MQFSPRTRGCSGRFTCLSQTPPVFPAHAGMFLVFDRYHITIMCFPRARGDVPDPTERLLSKMPFSPRTRGCSVKFRYQTCFFAVFPAHAGMFLMHVCEVCHP